MTTVHDFTLTDINGQPMPLAQFKGKVLLLVNVASACGLTPQYNGLQKIHTNKSADGFSVIGMPCNQFGAQEPGTEAEIKNFCSTKFDVTFPMTSKIDVNGPGRHPLYEFLAGKQAKFPGDITWNFEKFLISRQGEVIARFEPKQGPMNEELRAAINQALAQ
jgi:glutathione peroxidase